MVFTGSFTSFGTFMKKVLALFFLCGTIILIGVLVAPVISASVSKVEESFMRMTAPTFNRFSGEHAPSVGVSAPSSPRDENDLRKILKDLGLSFDKLPDWLQEIVTEIFGDQGS